MKSQAKLRIDRRRSHRRRLVNLAAINSGTELRRRDHIRTVNYFPVTAPPPKHNALIYGLSAESICDLHVAPNHNLSTEAAEPHQPAGPGMAEAFSSARVEEEITLVADVSSVASHGSSSSSEEKGRGGDDATMKVVADFLLSPLSSLLRGSGGARTSDNCNYDE